MIVVLEDGADLGLRRVRWRDRLAVRARTSAFDAALAAGTSPDSSVPLALHAGRLCEPTQRRLLARSVTRIVTASEAPARRRLAAPVCRSAVQTVRPQLAAVAGRLTSSGPVDVRGVARLRLLVADGTGPLYQPARADELPGELTAVLAALDSFASSA
jgi:hypothetical protein